MQNESDKLDMTCLPATVSRDNFQPPSPYVNEPIPEFDDAADIRDYLEIILRRKWLISILVLVSIATTFIVSLAMKPQYKANGKIELTIQSPRVTKFEDMARLGTQIQTRELMQTQMKLLKSETLGDSVIDKLQLEKNPALTPPPDWAVTKFLAQLEMTWQSFYEALFHSTGSNDCDRPATPNCRN